MQVSYTTQLFEEDGQIVALFACLSWTDSPSMPKRRPYCNDPKSNSLLLSSLTPFSGTLPLPHFR